MSSIFLMNLMLKKSKLQRETNANREMTKVVGDNEKVKELNRCRICNNGKASIPIFNNCHYPYLAEEIHNFSGIQISVADKFPKFMCNNCMKLLNGCILFRDMCQKTDKSFKEYPYEVDVKIAPKIHNFGNKPLAVQNKKNKKGKASLNISKSNNVGDDRNVNRNEMSIIKEEQNTTENNDDGNISEDSFSIPSPSFSDPETWSCSKCQKKFKTLHSYESHVPFCEQGVTPPEKKELFLCDICGRTTTTKTTLIFHKTIHFDVFPFKCDKCPYKGRTRRLLITHERSHTATSERTYNKCSLCPKICYNKANLVKHVKRIHGNNERTHKCTLCEKMFKFKSDLNRHVASIHTEKGNTQCKICLKMFRQKHLNRHMWRIHKIKPKKSVFPNRVPSYVLCSRSSEAANQETEQNVVNESHSTIELEHFF